MLRSHLRKQIEKTIKNKNLIACCHPVIAWIKMKTLQDMQTFIKPVLDESDASPAPEGNSHEESPFVPSFARCRNKKNSEALIPPSKTLLLFSSLKQVEDPTKQNEVQMLVIRQGRDGPRRRMCSSL